MVIRLLCVGGPEAGRHLAIGVAPNGLPAQVAVDYTAGGAELIAWYVPTRMVLFGRVLWVLVHKPLSADPAMRDLAVAQQVLPPFLFELWQVAEVVLDGH